MVAPMSAAEPSGERATLVPAAQRDATQRNATQRNHVVSVDPEEEK